MALAYSLRGTASGTGAVDTLSVTGFTPISSSLLVVVATGVLPGGRAAAPTLGYSTVSGLVAPFTNRVDLTIGTSPSSMVAIWTSLVGVVPPDEVMTITVDFNAVTLSATGTHTISVIQFTGHNASPIGPNFSGGSTTGRSGAYSGTLSSAPASTSYVIIGASGNTATVANTTVGTGWTEVQDSDPGDGVGFVQYRTGTVSTNVALDDFTVAAPWLVGGLEIKEAVPVATFFFDATDTDTTSITSGNTYTFPLTVSAAPPPRERLIWVGCIAGSDGTISAVSVDGVPATFITSYLGASTVSAYFSYLSVWRIPGTAATSISVVATYSGTAKASVSGYCACYRMTDCGVLYTARAARINDPSLTIPTTASGAVFAALLTFTGVSLTTSWSGVTENFDNVRALGDDVFTGGAASGVTASGARAVSANLTPNQTGLDDSTTAISLSFSVVAPAAANTILALPGTYTLSGQTALTRRGQRLVPVPATYAMSGQTATMKHGYWMRTPVAVAAAPVASVSSVAWGTGRTATVIPAPASLTASALNPNDKKDASVVLSNGNLTLTGSGASNNWARSTTTQTGRRYVEFTIATNTNSVVGIGDLSSLNYPGDDAGSFGLFSNGYGSIAGTFPNWSTSFTSGDVVGMAVDFDAKKVWFRKNGGIWNGNASYNPATATGGFSTSLYTGTPHYVLVSGDLNSVTTVNFGATAFAAAAPAGFAAWDSGLSGSLLLAGVFIGTNTPITVPSVTAPAGWTELTDSPLRVDDGSSFRADYHLYWKRAALEGSEYSFSHIAGGDTAAVMVAFSAASGSGDPIDAASKNAGTGSPSTLTGITTTIDNTKLVYFGNDWVTTAASTPPTGFTEHYDELLTVATKSQATAAATGNLTALNGNGGNPNYAWGAWLLALEPVAAGASYTMSGQSVVLNRTGASAGSGTITTTAGSYAVSGQTATPKRGLKTSALPSSYALTGQQVSLRRPGRVQALQGSYLVSGQTATPKYGKRVQTTTASYLINPDSVVAGNALIILPGSYATSGRVANLVYVAGSGGGVAVSTTGNSVTASTANVGVTISGGIAVILGGSAMAAQTSAAEIITTGGISVTLTGTALAATTSVGTATVSLPKVVQPTANEATASVGTVTVNAIASVSVTVTGNAMQTYVGTATVGVVAGVSGRQKAGEMFEIGRWMGH